MAPIGPTKVQVVGCWHSSLNGPLVVGTPNAISSSSPVVISFFSAGGSCTLLFTLCQSIAAHGIWRWERRRTFGSSFLYLIFIHYFRFKLTSSSSSFLFVWAHHHCRVILGLALLPTMVTTKHKAFIVEWKSKSNYRKNCRIKNLWVVFNDGLTN